MIFMHEDIIQIHCPRLTGDIKVTLSRDRFKSATSSCERKRTLVPLLLKTGSCYFDRGCEMGVVVSTSISSTYSLCSFSSSVLVISDSSHHVSWSI